MQIAGYSDLRLFRNGAAICKSRNLLLGGALSSFSQEGPFSVEVKLVTLLATVHDASGAPVTNLKKEDFRLEEDGVPQTIRYFSRESNLPLTVGLLVDTSQSETGMLERERRASYSFLDQILREDKDLAFIAHFDVRVEILQELTSSRQELALALGKLRIPRRPATLLYQAVRECSENQMKKQQGRKALIINLRWCRCSQQDIDCYGYRVRAAGKHHYLFHHDEEMADTGILSTRGGDPRDFQRARH